MTWTKLGVEFFDECAEADLSDAAVRTHTEALGYLYRVESGDMTIRRNLIPRFAGSPDWPSAVYELIACGLWIDLGSSVRVIHHGDVFRSSLAAQQLKRERDKKAQQKRRHVIGDVSADVSVDPTATQTDRSDIQTAMKRSAKHVRGDGQDDEDKAFLAAAG